MKHRTYAGLRGDSLCNGAVFFFVSLHTHSTSTQIFLMYIYIPTIGYYIYDYLIIKIQICIERTSHIISSLYQHVNTHNAATMCQRSFQKKTAFDILTYRDREVRSRELWTSIQCHTLPCRPTYLVLIHNHWRSKKSHGYRYRDNHHITTKLKTNICITIDDCMYTLKNMSNR